MCLVVSAQERAVSLPNLMKGRNRNIEKNTDDELQIWLAMGASNVGLCMPRPLSLNSSFAMVGMGPMPALN